MGSAATAELEKFHSIIALFLERRCNSIGTAFGR
jgi:hypothetical protein